MLCAFGGSLQAAQPGLPASDPVVARGVLRVATPGDYAPYASGDASTGALRGVDVELAQEIAVDLGLGVQWVPTRWGTLLEDARGDRFDVAVGGISRTAEREQEFPFTRSLLRDHKSPLTRCGEERRFDSLAEINQPAVRVVVNPGGTNEQFARRQFPRAQLHVHADNLTVFDEITAGRADVMVTDQVEARLRAQQSTGLCAASIRGWSPTQKSFMVVGNSSRQATIDAALGRALRRESYAQRLASWIGSPWTESEGNARQLQLARLAEERLTVVIEVARWKWNRKAAIEDLPRERTLLAGLRTAATARGMSAVDVETFFAAQIEAAKQLQRDLFQRWEKGRATTFAGVADLDQTLRPRIDALNMRMLETLAHWDGQRVERQRLGRLSIEALSPQAVGTALGPLTQQPGT